MRITFKNRQIKRRYILSIVCLTSSLIVPISKSQPVVKPVIQNTNGSIYSPFKYAGQKIQELIVDQMNINIEQGLLGYDLKGYLNQYKIKGGIPGEYLGKYVQADCRMYQYTGGREIREQMDSIIAVWLDFQQKNDGFLSPGVDWKSGGAVWEHKYV